MLKKTLLALFSLVAVLVGSAYLLPREVTVTREILINQSAVAVFPHINDWRLFNAWSPWFAKDPNASYQRSGSEFGVGAIHSWSGNEEVGVGKTEIIASKTNERVDVRLDFDGMAPSTYFIELKPLSANATQVKWSITMDMGYNPMARYFGLKLDEWIGADYQIGLENLRKVVESQPPVAVNESKMESRNFSLNKT